MTPESSLLAIRRVDSAVRMPRACPYITVFSLLHDLSLLFSPPPDAVYPQAPAVVVLVPLAAAAAIIIAAASAAATLPVTAVCGRRRVVAATSGVRLAGKCGSTSNHRGHEASRRKAAKGQPIWRQTAYPLETRITSEYNGKRGYRLVRRRGGMGPKKIH